MRTLDFYFDFMSPFAYLAHTQLPSIARRNGCEIAYHPIDLPAAKLAAGNTAPPNVSIPVKLRYLTTDMERWAKRYRVPIKFPKTLKSQRLNVGMLYAYDRGQSEAFANTAWYAAWGRGGDMDDTSLISAVAGAMDWNADDFLRFVETPGARERYAQVNRAAHERGVFGAPTMMLGDQMWWGNDRLGLLEEHLAAMTEGEGK